MSQVIPCGGCAARHALLLVALSSAGCAPADTANDEVVQLPRDSLGADTTDAGADSVTLNTPVVTVDTTRPTLPSIALPGRLPRDTVRAAAVVYGRAELEVDTKTFMPADYLLVRLQSGRSTISETWTTRSGEFYFENVRPGTYELQFLKSPKELRPVYRRQVTVTAGGKVSLPVVHIPVDSIKIPTRG
jgi:hypothetical protein